MAKVDLAGKLQDARARVNAEVPVEDGGLAKFARLTRKDARVRADQDAALGALATTLMRRRRVKSERITENTLIRVAIDLLLAHADHLRGGTERELRKSVTSAVRAPGTSADTDFGSSKVPGPQAPTVPNARGAGVRHGGVR